MAVTKQRILSFDVGIKNLAYCFLDTTPSVVPAADPSLNILDWRVLDLMQNGASPPGPIPTCTCKVGVPKKRSTDPLKVCGKTAKYTHPSSQDFYCETHAKSHAQEGWLIPKKVYERSSLNAMKRERLEALGTECRVVVPAIPKPTKAIWIEALLTHFQRVCYRRIESTGTPVNSKQMDLITLGRNMLHQLDNLPVFQEHPPTHVILENQISTVASRMKTIQGELTMYFLMRFPQAHIEYISSKNKLKAFSKGSDIQEANRLLLEAPTQNDKYKQHKRDAITYTQQLLDTHAPLAYWKPYVMSSKKKDDLCDCFLQGMWYIQN